MRDIEGIEEVVAKLRPHFATLVQQFEHENRIFIGLISSDHDNPWAGSSQVPTWSSNTTWIAFLLRISESTTPTTLDSHSLRKSRSFPIGPRRPRSSSRAFCSSIEFAIGWVIRLRLGFLPKSWVRFVLSWTSLDPGSSSGIRWKPSRPSRPWLAPSSSCSLHHCSGYSPKRSHPCTCAPTCRSELLVSKFSSAAAAGP